MPWVSSRVTLSLLRPGSWSIDQLADAIAETLGERDWDFMTVKFASALTLTQMGKNL